MRPTTCPHCNKDVPIQQLQVCLCLLWSEYSAIKWLWVTKSMDGLRNGCLLPSIRENVGECGGKVTSELEAMINYESLIESS